MKEIDNKMNDFLRRVSRQKLIWNKCISSHKNRIKTYARFYRNQSRLDKKMKKAWRCFHVFTPNLNKVIWKDA